MKSRISLVLVVSLLLATVAFASGRKLAISPSSAGVFNLNQNGAHSVELDGLCNQTPCNLSWTQVLSNSQVGSIDKTSGPETTFTAGKSPGTAIVIVTDGQGNSAFATITVW